MDATAVAAWLDERVATHEFSGVAMVWRDGVPLFSYAGGIAHRGHGVPVAETSRFFVASITKMATATAALRLVEQGKLRLDAPILDVLPGDQRPSALTRAHTLHHLLSHTSGLTNYHDDAATTWDSFLGAWDRVPTYHVRRPADMLPLFADLPAQRPPGEKYAYGDVNFILVGMVIEASTGRPWGDIAREEVFQPAGMVDTAIESLDLDPDRLAVGYLTDGGPPERWKANIFSVSANGMPDGGMITTAADLARLIDGLRAGRLLRADMLASMTRPQGPLSTELEQYGYGCELVVEDGGVTILGHGGADPGVSAMVAHHVAAATTIVVLCNLDRGSWAVTKRLTDEMGLRDPRD